MVGHPTDRNVFYFGHSSGGLWKTEDAGTFWIPVGEGQFRYASVGAIALHEKNPDIMYVGGVRSAQEMDTISRGAEAAMLTIADSAAMSSRSMLSHGAPRVRDGDENSTPIVRTALNLQPGRGGKVGASLMDHVVAS